MCRRNFLLIMTVSFLLIFSACRSNLSDTQKEETGTDSQAIVADYSEIISQYQTMVDCDFDSEVYEEGIADDYYHFCYISNILAHLDSSAIPTIQYSIHDINGDSIDELIIADGNETIYDLFSYDEKGPVSLFGCYYNDSETSKYPKEGLKYDSESLGYRQRVFINEDGTIIHLAYVGTRNRAEKMDLPAFSCELRTLEGVRDEDRNYYRLNGDGTETPCSMEEYVSYRDALEKESENNGSKMSFAYTKMERADSGKMNPLTRPDVYIPEDAIETMYPVACARCLDQYAYGPRDTKSCFWNCMSVFARYASFSSEYYLEDEEYPLYEFLPDKCFVDAGYAGFKDFSGVLSDYPLTDGIVYDPLMVRYGYENVGSELLFREVDSSITSDTTATAFYEIVSAVTNERLCKCVVHYVYNPHVEDAATTNYYYTIDSVSIK